MKTTTSELKRSYTLYACGYCDISFLMYGTSPTFSNSGVYGWNWSGYISPDYNAVIITGYRNLRGTWVSSEITTPFNEKARRLVESWDESWSEKAPKLEALRAEFFARLAEL